MTTDDPDLGRALRHAMDSYADTATAPAFDAPAIVRRTRRRRGLLAGAACAAAVAAIATGVLLLPSPATAPPASVAPAPTAPTSTPTAPRPSAPQPSGPATPAADPAQTRTAPPATGSGQPSAAPSVPPGTATTIVPNVTGLARAAAEQTLTTAGFRVEIHLFTDWKVPSGSVIAVGPLAGTALPPDSVVTLFVSKGKP
ncbi:PASTA domain-containing protein [Kitasatospora sp. NPDC091207]|uniref:PASTA domain-containing protein n=1 Tax=Kitasatospora sp. NPDC091207 TaxID=3364083 RepID=UPI0037FD8C3E